MLKILYFSPLLAQLASVLAGWVTILKRAEQLICAVGPAVTSPPPLSALQCWTHFIQNKGKKANKLNPGSQQ